LRGKKEATGKKERKGAEAQTKKGTQDQYTQKKKTHGKGGKEGEVVAFEKGDRKHKRGV